MTTDKKEFDEFAITSKEQAKKYIDGLLAEISDRRKRKAVRKTLLFNLRNKYGDIV